MPNSLDRILGLASSDYAQPAAAPDAAIIRGCKVGWACGRGLLQRLIAPTAVQVSRASLGGEEGIVIDTQQLDSFSRSMAELFLEAYPNWHDYVSLNPHCSGALVIKVPSPVPITGRALSIHTYNEELTIEFDRYHTHIGWAEQSDQEVFDQAKEFIDSILNEELVVGVKIRLGQWQGSNVYTREETANLGQGDVSYTCS